MSNETETPKYPAPLSLLEKKIGYRFSNPAIAQEALTHSSYANELRSKGEDCPYNERCEFLGDSILQILSSDYLFRAFPDSPEGDLTKVRAAIVCEDALCENARDISLGDYLRFGRGEEMNGGRTRKSILADAFEALLAAIYLDSGDLSVVKRFVDPYLVLRTSQLHGHSTDYKTQLQQIVQQVHGEILEYALVGEEGPDHNKTFTMEARLNSNVIGRGTGRSKREAEQMAAKEALSLFGESE